MYRVWLYNCKQYANRLPIMSFTESLDYRLYNICIYVIFTYYILL